MTKEMNVIIAANIWLLLQKIQHDKLLLKFYRSQD